MRFLEMAEQVAELARQQGGAFYLTEEGIRPGPLPLPVAAPGADPQWRPAVQPDGSLLQDPDFSLPSTAGPVQWRLFYDSSTAAENTAWGYGRRASFPLRLTSD